MAIEEFGAGLQIGPNAARALRELGVWDDFAPLTVAPRQIRIFDGPSGRSLRAIDLDQIFERRHGAPYRVARRADLSTALYSAAHRHSEIGITTAMRLESYRSDSVSVACRFNDGTHLSANALVAADGIHSTVRRQMHGTNQPQFIGHVIYRTMLPTADVPERMDKESVCLWLCPGGHVVHYPVKSGEMLNLVAALDDTAVEAGWNAPASPKTVLDGFRANAAVLTTLLDACSTWRKWTAADLAPASNWTDGPVTLIGDAAHASLPYLAQGAAMALEDAVVLGQCCTPGRGIAAAFQEFERRRKDRTRRVARVSRRLGRTYHSAGTIAALRNAAICSLPGLTNPVRHDWLYSWQP